MGGWGGGAVSRGMVSTDGGTGGVAVFWLVQLMGKKSSKKRKILVGMRDGLW